MQSGNSLQMNSQRVTKKDIAQGQVRIPAPTKVMFPDDPTTLEFTLRGQSLSGKWNPGFGSDKERSGILRVGKAVLTALVKPEEVLQVTKGSSGIELI